MKRKRRVRIHLIEPKGSESLPSVEGFLHSKRGREYVVALPQLLVAAGATPVEPDCRYLVVPRERVAFYEVLR